MGELVFVGLGLHDCFGISVRGLEETRTADRAFIELYTSLLPEFSKEEFERLSGKRLEFVSRHDVEEDNGKIILDATKSGKTVLLVPGDPLIATTHVALRIAAQKSGISTRVIHGASVLSAVIGLSGLHNYKFGKSVTIPFPDENPSDTPHGIISQNKRLGLHTLCLLDIQTERQRYLDVKDALRELLKTENTRRTKAVTMDTLAVGVARAGSDSPVVRAAFVRDLLKQDFGQPPFSLIFPGKLHFTEAEALIVLADAPEAIRSEVE